MTTDTAPVTITGPGVYTIPDDTYLNDPTPNGSLSASGARRLLPPSCPAIFDWERKNGRPAKSAFDFGHAAHKAVLGTGPEIVIVDAEDWRSKAARDAREAAYAAGAVPLLAEDVARVEGMADALRRHPIASALFDPARGGQPEQSLFATDNETGVQLRGRLDWLPAPTGGRMVIPDYKSTVSADPDAFARSSASYGYYMQAAWYCDLVAALYPGADPAFVFVAQEKTAPYLITVFEPDAVCHRVGRQRNRQAIEIFRDCTEAGVWPGYSDEIELISLPPWLVRQHDDGFL